MMLDINFWIILATRILAGSALLCIAAFLLARLVKQSSSERAIWQAALVVLGLFVFTEFAGFNLPGLLKQRNALANEQPQRTPRVVVQAASASETASNNSRPITPPAVELKSHVP